MCGLPTILEASISSLTNPEYLPHLDVSPPGSPLELRNPCSPILKVVGMWKAEQCIRKCSALGI